MARSEGEVFAVMPGVTGQWVRLNAERPTRRDVLTLMGKDADGNPFRLMLEERDYHKAEALRSALGEVRE